MIRVYPRTSLDVSYFTNDPALELDGLRAGPAGRWLRGDGPMGSDEVARVFASTSRARTVGYDIVMAAPRPTSILLAVDPSSAQAIVAAHQAATREAMAYLEDRALVVRDRRFGGDYEDAASWSRIAAFTHGVNRHGEPHLHDHVLVGAQPQGHTGVLERRALSAHLLAADALYGAHLRQAVARDTPWQPWRSFYGTDHVLGLDEGYRALWGGHFDDRPAKEQWTRSEITQRWSMDLTRFEEVAMVPAPRRDRMTLDEHRFAGSLEGLTRVARSDLVAAWANAAPWGVAASDVDRAVTLQYPELNDTRGSREETISVSRARQLSVVRDRGERSLDGRWEEERHRSLSRPSLERSR